MKKIWVPLVVVLSFLAGCCEDSSSGWKSECGNGMVEPGEECDGVNLQGLSCGDFGYLQGYGRLKCDEHCRLDFSECITAGCGNGIVEEGEECEPGDPPVLAGETCESQGYYYGGTLGCTDECRFDHSQCVPGSCGDGQVQPGHEICDASGIDSWGELHGECIECTTEWFADQFLISIPQGAVMDTEGVTVAPFHAQDGTGLAVIARAGAAQVLLVYHADGARDVYPFPEAWNFITNPLNGSDYSYGNTVLIHDGSRLGGVTEIASSKVTNLVYWWLGDGGIARWKEMELAALFNPPLDAPDLIVGSIDDTVDKWNSLAGELQNLHPYLLDAEVHDGRLYVFMGVEPASSFMGMALDAPYLLGVISLQEGTGEWYEVDYIHWGMDTRERIGVPHINFNSRALVFGNGTLSFATVGYHGGDAATLRVVTMSLGDRSFSVSEGEWVFRAPDDRIYFGTGTPFVKQDTTYLTLLAQLGINGIIHNFLVSYALEDGEPKIRSIKEMDSGGDPNGPEHLAFVRVSDGRLLWVSERREEVEEGGSEIQGVICVGDAVSLTFGRCVSLGRQVLLWDAMMDTNGVLYAAGTIGPYRMPLEKMDESHPLGYAPHDYFTHMMSLLYVRRTFTP